MVSREHLVRMISNHIVHRRLRLEPGASVLLLLSSIPRVTKGPVPAILAITSASAGVYYGNTVWALRG